MTLDRERLKDDLTYWDEHAPAGATHYNDSPNIGYPWLRKTNSGLGWFYNERWHMYTNKRLKADHLNTAIPKPPEQALEEKLRHAFLAGFDSALATYRDDTFDIPNDAKAEQYLDSLKKNNQQSE